MNTAAVETVGVFCQRYGPGRLPGASRPAVGAGYAVATAALAAGVAFVVLTGVETLLFGFLFFAANPSRPSAAVVAGLLGGIAGFFLTFWLTLPIGAVSGWIHERVVTEH
jgi:hypothetical protein